MADMMKSQTARFGTFLKAAFGSKGASLLDIIPFVAPSFELNTDRPDMLALKGEYIYDDLVTGTAAAAQFPTAWFGCANVGEIWVIEQLMIESSTAQIVIINSTVAAMPGATHQAQLDDKRVLSTNRIGAQTVFSSEAAAFVANRHSFHVQANVPLIVPMKFITTVRRGPPASACNLTVQGQTALTNLVVTGRGYARVCDTNEEAP